MADTPRSLSDLQTLLEKHLYVSDEGDLEQREFPFKGTRVEMTGLTPSFYTEIAEFDKLASYMQEVIPLKFDHSKFKWSSEIENQITTLCEQHNAKYELIDIKLQVHNKVKSLYKPYYDSCFSNENPQEPVFQLVSVYVPL